MSDQLWHRDENWVGSEVDDSFVMVNIDTGKYVALNSTASAVWNALSEPRTATEIEAQLREQFDVDEQACKESVAKLLGQMQDLQLAAAR